jgi:glycosyltransferase involved in cell wall biosynthesis
VRVLHVIHSIDKTIGGTTSALLNIIRLENEMGCSSNILTLEHGSHNDEFKQYVESIVAVPASFPARFSHSRPSAKWFRLHAREFDFVVFHSLWFIMVHLLARICKKMGVPFVVWPHSSLDPLDLLKKRYLKILIGPLVIKRTLSEASFVCCTSQLEAERLETYGANPTVTTLPLPVDTFQGVGDRIRFRKKYSFNDSEFVFLFLSRIDYKKGLNLLIPAFTRLNKTFPHVRLVIAGSDSRGYKKKVEILINENSIKSKILFTGFLTGNDKIDAFLGCDCFVLPSMFENFGIATIEALQTGLPTLISDNVFIWKELSQYYGVRVCSYDTNSLYDSMKEIVENGIMDKEQREIVKQVAEQYYPKTLLPRYRELYHTITHSD